MLRTLAILVLLITSLATYANTISFCANGYDLYHHYLALDGKVYHIGEGGVNCFDHDTTGTSLVLFTDGFDVTYQSTKCGNADPCIIPLKLTDGRTLASFIVESKVLLTQYN